MSPRPDPSLLRPRVSSGIAQRFFSATKGGGIVAAAGPIGQSGAIAGDGTLTLFVKREGDPSWAEVVVGSGASVARLTEAVQAKLPSLVGKDASTLTLHVARDKAGKDVGVALDSSDSLAAVNLQAGAKIVIKVAARMAVLPAVPASITFEDSGLLDAEGAPMQVAQLAPLGRPFFVEDKALKKLMSWASGLPNDEDGNKLLVLSGPIKSGKTTMLRKVLPGVLAAQHAAAGGRTPVIFAFTFSLKDRPPAAAMELCNAAAGFAGTLGFRLPNPPSTPSDALLGMGRMMGELAMGIAAAGGELILLLDEVQVR